MESISCHTTPLVNSNLGGAHTNTHTQTFADRSIFKTCQTINCWQVAKAVAYVSLPIKISTNIHVMYLNYDVKLIYLHMLCYIHCILNSIIVLCYKCCNKFGHIIFHWEYTQNEKLIICHYINYHERYSLLQWCVWISCLSPFGLWFNFHTQWTGYTVLYLYYRKCFLLNTLLAVANRTLSLLFFWRQR